jgi:adenylate kinase family enzyme
MALFGTAGGGSAVQDGRMRRVSVVGNSGSGKSRLGRALAQALDVPYVELDAIFHQPGWRPLPDDEFLTRVHEAAAGDAWVIDGNYSTVREAAVWPRADTVVWFDLPRRTVMRRIVWRSLRRVATRQELWNGNRERLRSLVAREPEDSIIRWAWTRHALSRRRYGEAAAAPEWAHLDFVRIAGRTDADDLLQRARRE